MQSPFRKVLVVGGSGFLGQAICQSAARRGWEVLSLSRHGQPTTNTNTHSMAKVRWVKGDALKPETFMEYLDESTAVVHSVGALMENNYKTLVNVGARSHELSGTTTYEKANRDTALSVSNTAKGFPNVSTFVYISASDVVPFLDPRYISTKREVEAALLDPGVESGFRPVIFRPGFMYSSERPISMPIAAGVNIFGKLFRNTPVGCLFKNTQFEKAAHIPIHRETVANAVVTALEDPKIRGVLEIDDIIRVASNPSNP